MMPVSPARFRWIAKDELLQRIGSCVHDVLDVFAHIAVQREYSPGRLEPAGGIVTATVTYQGSYGGSVAIHCPASLASRIACGMRGVAYADQNQVDDALGELASILGGDIKLFLSPGGHDITLSLPVVSRSAAVAVGETGEPEEIHCSFLCGKDRFLVTATVRKERPYLTETARALDRRPSHC